MCSKSAKMCEFDSGLECTLQSNLTWTKLEDTLRVSNMSKQASN